MSVNKFSFGYPKIGSCVACSHEKLIGLKVEPHYNPTTKSQIKLMLIGQDPTITNKPERVKEVLMLDKVDGQLSKWLRGIFGEKFDLISLYATNTVKCTFASKPSNNGNIKFLKLFYDNCKCYLVEEVQNYKPTLVITFGEATHKLFLTIVDNGNKISSKMKDALTGNFVRAKIGSVEFDYSPCLHIQTFRVAETYGNKIDMFNKNLLAYLDNNK